MEGAAARETVKATTQRHIVEDQRTVPIAQSGGRDRYATGLQHSVAKGLKSPAFFTRKKSRPDSSLKLYLTGTSLWNVIYSHY